MAAMAPRSDFMDNATVRLRSYRNALVALTCLSPAPLAACDADDPTPPFIAPTPSFPREGDDRAFALSEVGLFDGSRLAPDLIAFEPRWPLWSDGLRKRRWLRLPPNAVIDTRDPDHWQLPVGAILFKEFADAERPIETRVIARIGPDPFDYWMGAFRWRGDGSDADFVRGGAVNVGGDDGDHDIPSAEACWSCHVGTPGRMLGLGALQLATSATLAALPLSADVPGVSPPGDDDTQAALGYLHANCAHCHSPIGVARPDTDLDLALSVRDLTTADTGAYRTAVNVATRSWLRPDFPLRVAPGDAAGSAIVVRMRHRRDLDQMPPLATKHADDEGLALIERWISDL